MAKRTAITACIGLAALAFCTAFSAPRANAQIMSVMNADGRKLFVNSEPPVPVSAKLTAASKPHTNIYMNPEVSFMGTTKQTVSIDRDGAEKLVKEAAEKHRVDPALVRAVIETESNWNPNAYSRKGAGGLMQLIPTTAQRFGANDLFNPQQNIDAGVHYLRTLLERYNGNLDLALAAYNAGEGAVDRAHGVPSFRETRNYVQKVQDAYFRPGSGRQGDAFMNAHAIHRDVSDTGRIVFRND